MSFYVRLVLTGHHLWNMRTLTYWPCSSLSFLRNPRSSRSVLGQFLLMLHAIFSHWVYLYEHIKVEQSELIRRSVHSIPLSALGEAFLTSVHGDRDQTVSISTKPSSVGHWMYYCYLWDWLQPSMDEWHRVASTMSIMNSKQSAQYPEHLLSLLLSSRHRTTDSLHPFSVNSVWCVCLKTCFCFILTLISSVWVPHSLHISEMRMNKSPIDTLSLIWGQLS